MKDKKETPQDGTSDRSLLDSIQDTGVSRRKVLKTSAALAGAAAMAPALRAAAAPMAKPRDLSEPGIVPKLVDWGAGMSPEDAASAWAKNEFQPSTLSHDEQMKELQWFIDAAKPFRGMHVTAVSETLNVHEYESQILTKAFEELTGIHVTHTYIQEGEVVDKLETEFQTGRDIYDIFMNDSDFIGTHPRLQDVHPISDWIAGDGKKFTLPTLDLDDFQGKSFATWVDGKLYQMPDQQFANLYWYRHDWFQRPDLRKKFKDIYGYELDVPVNWSAYEDIADFFTNKVKEIDGVRVYGHMDYGKKDPSLGWRFTDAWLSMAGEGDKGLPNGRPVDEWGIRMNEHYNPVGASVERGGGANSPAAVYALATFIDWLKKYAPPEAAGMTFSEAGPVPSQGHIAQQVFWYSAFAGSMTKPGLPVVNDDGTPKWRMAPSPHGAYWEPGMKVGYQDQGCWTLPKSTPIKKLQAAWLYAQFCVCKSVSLRKLVVGLAPIRSSDIHSDAMTKLAPKLGGLIEFYRSPGVKYWTPTGVNVPEYAKLTQVWWPNVSDAISGAVTPQQAMDKVAEEMDSILYRIQRSGVETVAPPILNPKKSKEYWFSQPGAPKPKLANEKPQGRTMPYDQILKAFSDPTILKG